MTLQELGEFVGLGNATPPLSTYGIQQDKAQITMLSVANVLGPFLSSTEKKSLRAMILALSRLPPISLEADWVGDWSGDEPFSPTLRVQPSGGAVRWTGLTVAPGLPVSEGGAQGPPTLYQDVPNVLADTRLSSTSFDAHGRITSVVTEDFGPGGYLVTVKRTGVQSTGLTVLQRDLFFRVNALSRPGPSTPPASPSPSGGPPTATKYGKVTIYNCTIDRAPVEIWVRDLTLGQEYTSVSTLEPQFDDNNTCPAFGSEPVEIPLADSHQYEIVALNSERAGCILNDGDSADPLNADCWQDHLMVVGSSNGPALLQYIN